MTLPTDSKERKTIPLVRGLLDYFPAALAEVARVSYVGNEQHNPGQELFDNREKSNDDLDCALRHLLERGRDDTDGLSHLGKVAWRVLRALQKQLEEEGAPAAPAAKWPSFKGIDLGVSEWNLDDVDAPQLTIDDIEKFEEKELEPQVGDFVRIVENIRDDGGGVFTGREGKLIHDDGSPTLPLLVSLPRDGNKPPCKLWFDRCEVERVPDVTDDTVIMVPQVKSIEPQECPNDIEERIAGSCPTSKRLKHQYYFKKDVGARVKLDPKFHFEGEVKKGTIVSRTGADSFYDWVVRTDDGVSLPVHVHEIDVIPTFEKGVRVRVKDTNKSAWGGCTGVITDKREDGMYDWAVAIDSEHFPRSEQWGYDDIPFHEGELEIL